MTVSADKTSAAFSMLRLNGVRLGYDSYVPFVLLIVAVVIGIVEPRFVSGGNLINMLLQTSLLAIFAYAQMFPLITRGFDLSLGATVSLASVVAALTMTRLSALGEPAAVLCGIVAGAAVALLVGTVNGGLVARVGLNPFIVTLGTWNIVDGIASSITGGFPVPTPPLLNRWLSESTLFSIPLAVFAVAAAIGLVWLLLDASAFGRRLYLVGSNPSASILGGINHRWINFASYLLCAALAAVGAMLLTARAGSGEPNLGGNLTLQSIAAAVIGGVSLRGGAGRFYAPLLGSLFLTVLSSAMNFFSIDSYVQEMFLGAIIVAAVCFDRQRRT